MDFMRRCMDCGRLLHGHAGNACPHCAGDRLETVELRADAPVFKHASILTAVLTFCIGLLVLCALFTWLNPQFSFATQNYGQMLWRLQAVITGGTALYLILRRSEGDFRALFCVSLGLFVLSEIISALIRFYGFLALSGLTSLTNMGLCIFSSLALSASFADGQRRDGYARILTFSASGLMFLAAVRVFYDLRIQDMDVRGNRIVAGIVAAMAIMVGSGLLMCFVGERRTRSRLQTASLQEDSRLQP